MALARVDVSGDGLSLKLDWQDGKHARFHAIWLRDNCQDADTRSAANGQRLITIDEIAETTRIGAASILQDGTLQVAFAPELRTSLFADAWLRHNSYDDPGDAAAAPQTGFSGHPVLPWDAGLQDRCPRGDWDAIRHAPPALADWLASVRTYGIALLDGMPAHSGAVCAVAELFGYVRETNYGRWFDVRAEINPSNLAYTHLGLQAHTDNPYRDPVPTLQLLGCLENSVDGGESVVVDGLQAALRLRSEAPEDFRLLSRYRASFEYAGSDGVHLCAHKPMIEVAPDGEISAIRFNNRSLAPLVHVPFAEMAAYYQAYRHFARIIDDTSMQVSFRLAPGQLFIVDNTRVLHARKPFSGSGQRWLQGCYADKDGLLSTLRAIENQSRQEVTS